MPRREKKKNPTKNQVALIWWFGARFGFGCEALLLVGKWETAPCHHRFGSKPPASRDWAGQFLDVQKSDMGFGLDPRNFSLPQKRHPDRPFRRQKTGLPKSVKVSSYANLGVTKEHQLAAEFGTE